jgi:hypothetical protein
VRISSDDYIDAAPELVAEVASSSAVGSATRPGSRLARTCQGQRQLNRLRDPHPLSDQLPRDRVNILLVTARPFDADVRYRSIQDRLPGQLVPSHRPQQVPLTAYGSGRT